MGVTFKADGPRESLHLNNFNTRDLLEALGYDRSGGLDRTFAVEDVLPRCEDFIAKDSGPGRPKIDWKVDPEIGDVYEGVRRLRSLAVRSKGDKIEAS